MFLSLPRFYCLYGKLASKLIELKTYSDILSVWILRKLRINQWKNVQFCGTIILNVYMVEMRSEHVHPITNL